MTTAPLLRGLSGQVQKEAVTPRLLSLKQAGEYLNVSAWTVRDWALAGRLPLIHLPALRAREGDRPKTSLRRVVIDRADLDAFIESLKDGPGQTQKRAVTPSISPQQTGAKYV
ncbi:MAG: helix-turn-helix domain-containing protein [Vicinamibacterales bacterium]